MNQPCWLMVVFACHPGGSLAVQFCMPSAGIYEWSMENRVRCGVFTVTAIPKVPDDLGVLPETYANDDGCPGPSRSRRKWTHGIEEVEELEEEEEEDKEEDDHADDERSPTDTRAPQLPLPETLPSSQPDAFALNAW